MPAIAGNTVKSLESDPGGEMAAPSVSLPGKSTRTEEPGRLAVPAWAYKVGHDLATEHACMHK